MAHQIRHKRYYRRGPKKGSFYWAGRRTNGKIKKAVQEKAKSKNKEIVKNTQNNVERRYPLNIFLDHKIGLRTILGAFKLIAGSTGTGKSNTMAVLIEEYFRYNMPMHLIDIEGEHLSFAKEFNRVKLLDYDKYQNMKNFKSVLTTVVNGRYSLIIDMSSFPEDDKAVFLKNYLDTLWEIESINKVPLALIIEEAHILVPQGKNTTIKNRLVDFAKRGRKRKVEVTFVTQRVQDIDKQVITQAETSFLHKVTHPTDLAVYKALIPSKQIYQKVLSLGRGQVVFVHGDNVFIGQVRKRKTEHGAQTIHVGELKPPLKKLMSRHI